MATAVGTAVAMTAFHAGASVATVTALTVNAAAIGSAIITAASIGYSLYQADQMRQGFDAMTGISNDQGLQLPVKQAIPPQRLILGSGTSSGAVFFSHGDEDSRPYVYFGYLLANHECEGLEAIYLNNHKVLIDENGDATATPYNDGSTSFIKASSRNGSIDQAIDPIIAADFPDMPSTFRQRGHTTIVVKAHFGADRDAHELLYGSSGFNPIFRIKGARIYDPRDPTQILADPSTYKWSDNASLCFMHFLRWKWPHLLERINWDQVAIAADIDDEWGFTKSGLAYRKGTVNGVVQSHEDGTEVIQSLLTANSGKLIIDEGKMYPVPAHRKLSVGTFHDGMLKGGISFTPHKPYGELVNTMKVEFMAEDRDNKFIVGPVIQDVAAVTKDGGERERSIRLPFTETHQRAQMIANRSLKDGRQEKQLVAGSTIECLAWRPGQVIEVDLQSYPLVNGRYEIISKTWDEQMNGYSLELLEYADSIHDYDPANDERDFELDQSTLEAA